MKTITADIFIKHWLEFSKTLTSNNNNWENIWDSNTEWSKFILGTKSSKSDCFPIGGILQLLMM